MKKLDNFFFPYLGWNLVLKEYANIEYAEYTSFDCSTGTCFFSAFARKICWSLAAK